MLPRKFDRRGGLLDFRLTAPVAEYNQRSDSAEKCYHVQGFVPPCYWYKPDTDREQERQDTDHSDRESLRILWCACFVVKKLDGSCASEQEEAKAGDSTQVGFRVRCGYTDSTVGPAPEDYLLLAWTTSSRSLCLPFLIPFRLGAVSSG